MTAAWPGTVNTSNFGTNPPYSETPDTNFAEFQPEVGPPKRRRRMSISSDTIAFSLIMTTAEYANFLTFYRTTISDGTLPFTFPRPRTGSTETWNFVGKAPTMRFLDFGLYEVSLTMKNVP